MYKPTTKVYDAMSKRLEKNEAPFHVKALWEEFLKRSDRNRSYSLSSFSRDLDLEVGHLIRVLKGERVLRFSTAVPIMKKIKFSNQASRLILRSLYLSEKRRVKRLKRRAEEQTKIT